MNDKNLHEASAQWRSRPADQRFETLDSLQAAVDSRIDLETRAGNLLAVAS